MVGSDQMSALSEMAESIAAANTKLDELEPYVSNAQILKEVQALRAEFAEVKKLVDGIAEQAAPVIAQIAASPLVKMLGGK